MLRSLLAALVVLAAPASAQGVDWGDHSDALLAVPRAAVQVEAALDQTLALDDQTDVGVTVRWGVAPGLEVRAGIPTYSRTLSTTGLGDPTVGAKLELGSRGGWGAAATAEVSLPLGGAFGDTALQPTLVLAVGRDLPAQFALEVIGEVAVASGPQTATGGAALILSRPIAGPVETSLELITSVSDLDVGAVLLQNGYVVLLSPRVQFTGYLAVGLEGAAAPDALVGIGGSVRL